MIKCTICNKELSEEAFYPSTLKKGLHHCKKCMYEKWQKDSHKRYVESLKELPDKDFDRFYGGYNIKILNFVRPEEHKYMISSTSGMLFMTNDLEEFMDKLWEELRPEK